MMNQVMKVRKQALVDCMTCPLCNKLLNEATTISECLHTFCRKCIYDKLTDEEADCCPVCDIDLGCVPVEKLRPDHSLQDLIMKVFPLKKGEATTEVSPEIKPEITPEVTPNTSTLPVRRKERSLSSLVVSTPRVSPQNSSTGRRTKAAARRAAALRGSNFTIEESIKKEEDSHEDHSKSSSSPETLSKIVRRRQNSSTAKLSNHQIPNKDKENIGESWATKIDQWRPLNCLVEAANRTKTHKSSSQGSSIKLEQANEPGSEVYAPRPKVHDDKNDTDLIPLGLGKPNMFHKMGKKKVASSVDISVRTQAVLDAMAVKRDKSTIPIWFKLVASEDQEGDAPLQQISSCYLRIKDGSMPVSFIQKYLVKKLNLTSEAEVEIRCRGQPVVPSLQLYNLMDLWLQTATPSERFPASVGASATEFLMVLVYSRKV